MFGSMTTLVGDDRAAGRCVGAEIGEGRDARGQEMAVRIDRELAASDVVAGVEVADEGVAALADPFHAALQLAGGIDGQRLFLVQRVLAAEAAADIVHQHADLFGRHPQHVACELRAHPVRHLRAGMQRDLVEPGLVRRNRAARLDRVLDDPVVDHVERDDARRSRECRLNGGAVAQLPVEAEILRRIVPHQRRIGTGAVVRLRHRRQRLVLDLHQLRRIARLLQCPGDDERHRVTGEAGAVAGQQRLVFRAERGAGFYFRYREAGDRADSVRREIGGGQHGDDAGGLQRRFCVDSEDPRMSVRRAQDMAVDKVREAHIVDEPAFAAQQARVFAPMHRLAYTELAHGYRPCMVGG